MNMDFVIPAVSIVTALLIIAGVVIVGRRATLRAATWWLGLACLPLAAWLTGMVPYLIDCWNSLAAWWQQLARPFEPLVMAGLVLGGIGLVLLFGSRLIPYKKRTPKVRKNTAGATAVRPTTPSTGYPGSTPTDSTF